MGLVELRAQQLPALASGPVASGRSRPRLRTTLPPQVTAAHSLLHRDQSAWRCSPAPGPGEAVWPNLGLRAWERTARRLLALGVFVVITLFYLIPITAVQVGCGRPGCGAGQRSNGGRNPTLCPPSRPPAHRTPYTARSRCWRWTASPAG